MQGRVRAVLTNLLQGAAGVEVAAQDLLAAEPDVLRKAADELIRVWNE